MKLLILFALLLMSLNIFSYELTVTNQTSGNGRVDSLIDNCDTWIVKSANPYYLKAGESVTFKNLAPVMHHYRVCAGGWCSGSSIGMTIDQEYFLNISLNEEGFIRVESIPDVFPGNLNCSNEP